MRLSEIGELTLLETIRKRFSKKTKDIIVGIGDDAAAVKPKNKKLLFTTDMMVEGIHFDLNFMSPYQLGFKLVSVNVSDICAMGGTPQYLLLDIAMNKNAEQSFIDRFFDGIRDSMKLYRVSLIGGDLCSSKKDIIISASLTGCTDRPIRRSGAKVGDKIYVTGNLGDSACGLEVLKKAVSYKLSAFSKRPTANSYPLITKFSRMGLTWHIVKPLLQRHLMPVARNSKSFMRAVTAMIDISDGLFIDLSRLCNESRVGARIYEKLIPVSSQMKKVSSALRLNTMKLATTGGEDYELLFAAHPTTPIPSLVRRGAGVVKITCIGEITKKDRIIVDESGRKSTLKAEGYQHFGIKG